jgi:hypothetical protein
VVSDSDGSIRKTNFLALIRIGVAPIPDYESDRKRDQYNAPDHRGRSGYRNPQGFFATSNQHAEVCQRCRSG